MTRMVYVANFTRNPEVTDGGSSREDALATFVCDQGGECLTVCDGRFKGNAKERFTRAGRLLREIEELNPELVVLSYPSYPFFWQHKVTRYFWTSVQFTRQLSKLARKIGFRVVIDIMDLPVFQYKDLGFGLEMRPETLRKFDRFIFGWADYLWVCSESLAEVIAKNYAIPKSRMIVALNGYRDTCKPDTSADCTDNVLRFTYAGSLNPERGIKHLIDSFLANDLENCELHLCGPFGEWIDTTVQSKAIFHHGSLFNDQACEIMSGCDVGLIPYPERGYYHLAFATKLGFYLGLGMPVLSSNAHETASHVKRLGVGLCWNIDDFASAFAYINAHREELCKWRKRAMEARGDFNWSTIYANALSRTCEGHM